MLKPKIQKIRSKCIYPMSLILQSLVVVTAKIPFPWFGSTNSHELYRLLSSWFSCSQLLSNLLLQQLKLHVKVIGGWLACIPNTLTDEDSQGHQSISDLSPVPYFKPQNCVLGPTLRKRCFENIND